MVSKVIPPQYGHYPSVLAPLRASKAVAGYCLFVFLLAATTGVLLHWHSGGADDAFIAYRYARNIADGYGFVWNPGEQPVYGATSVLYVHVLAAAGLLGLSIPQFSIAFGILCRACTAVLVFLLGRKVHSTLVGVCASVLFAVSYSTALWSPGLETQFYTLLIVLAFYLYELDRLDWCAAVCGLIGMTRLDGFMVPVVLGLHYLWRQRQHLWELRRVILRGVAIFGLVLLPWLLFCLYQFGTIFPLSFYAKRAHGEGISGAFSVRLLPGWFESSVVFGSLIALGCLGVLWLFWARPNKFLAVVLWAVLFYAEYQVAGLPNFPWYYTPPFFVIFLLAAIGFVELLSKVPAPRESFQAIAKVLLGCVMLGYVWVGVSQGAYEVVRRDPFGRNFLQKDDRNQLATWLVGQGVRPTQTMLTFEVGMIGYFTNMKVIDSLGLVSPEVVPHLLEKDHLWSVLHYRPDYVGLVDIPQYRPTWPVYQSIWFRQNYREVFRLPRRGYDMNYLIYQSVSPSPPIPGEVEMLYRKLTESRVGAEEASLPKWDLTSRDRWTLRADLQWQSNFSPTASLRLASTGGDPFMHTEVDLNPFTVESLEITMRVKPSEGRIMRAAELFWLSENSRDYSEDKHVLFDIQPDGKWHTYNIPLRNRRAWLNNGRVNFLRLDPTVFPASIEIREIGLLPSTTLPSLSDWYARLVE